VAAAMIAFATLLHAQTGGQQHRSHVLPDSTFVPGSLIGVTPEPSRDSLSTINRLRRDARLDSMYLVLLLDSLDRTMQARMRRNLAMSPADWRSTKSDRDRREADLRRAMDMDFVFPHAYMPLFSVSTGAVFRALGLVEDVTPRITYTLTHTQQVTVRIYNLEADLIATIVDGSQRPGVYDFEWDFNDASGNRVPYGNYVAEVIVRGTLVLRKRIEVP
jgi:hypothetical protein